MSAAASWHGTASGYSYHGCRCVPCRDANASKTREYRYRTGRRTPAKPLLKEAVLNTDPAIPADGGCAMCGKSRTPKVGKSGQGGNALVVADAATDPFCSADCCRKYHGTPRQAGSYVVGTTCDFPDSPPTLLQQARLARSGRRQAELDAGLHVDRQCDWCGVQLPDDGYRRRFCCNDHKVKYHGLYKKAPIAA